jgi:uncharacterized protein (DUF1697 family)
MTAVAVLLRAVNVSGTAKLKMGDLKAALEGLGFTGARTYLQSGNAVINPGKVAHAQLAPMIAAALETACGLKTEVMIRTHAELKTILDRAPFPSGALPNQVLVTFLTDTPDPEGVAWLKTYDGPEAVVVDGQEIFTHYVNGVGVSKLNRLPIEKRLKVRGTGRNLNTVRALLEMTGED